MQTPVTKSGLKKYDHLAAEDAVKAAWNDAGNSPFWHNRCKADVADLMPLLARALERL